MVKSTPRQLTGASANRRTYSSCPTAHGRGNCQRLPDPELLGRAGSARAPRAEGLSDTGKRGPDTCLRDHVADRRHAGRAPASPPRLLRGIRSRMVAGSSGTGNGATRNSRAQGGNRPASQEGPASSVTDPAMIAVALGTFGAGGTGQGDAVLVAVLIGVRSIRTARASVRLSWSWRASAMRLLPLALWLMTTVVIEVAGAG